MDSNVLIDYMALILPQSGSDFVEQLFNDDFLISIVVKIEVLGYNDIPQKMAAMEEFVSAAILFPLDDDVSLKTIELRRLYRKLKLGDAIIAATALVNDFTLISRNISDFKQIKGLEVIDAHVI
jgi:predicted nucleic acid-binding protein